MKRRSNSLDVRAIVSAERLLSGVIARARRNARPTPIAPVRRTQLRKHELTAKEVREHVARLVCLSRAICDLSLPVKLAGRMLHSVDLADLTDQIEGHVQAVYGLLDGYKAAHPEIIEALEKGGETIPLVIEIELASAGKELAKLRKIGHGAVLDIGTEYLPLD